MHEYRWRVSDEPRAQEIVLRINTRRGWIGWKALSINGTTLYRRGPFAGIAHWFRDPSDPARRVHLRAVLQPDTQHWVPALTVDGVERPELTGTPPPRVVRRTQSIALVTGVAYLTMFMMVIMTPHIWNMLYATMGRSDMRSLILEVVDASAPSSIPDLILPAESPPPAIAGQPYQATFEATGGTPPYEWEVSDGRLPSGLSLGAGGAVTGVPEETGDSVVHLRAIDATQATATRPYVFRVEPEAPTEPRIVTAQLLPAVRGEAYSFKLEAVGGEPPYDWITNRRRFPRGMSFKPAEALLTGTPEDKVVQKNGEEVIEPVAGLYPLRFRVFDASFSPWSHIGGWIVPFACTSICLLGYWSMRRWSVVLYGVLIVAQCVIGVATAWLPFTWGAIVVQLIVLGVGVANYGKME